MYAKLSAAIWRSWTQENRMKTHVNTRHMRRVLHSLALCIKCQSIIHSIRTQDITMERVHRRVDPGIFKKEPIQGSGNGSGVQGQSAGKSPTWGWSPPEAEAKCEISVQFLTFCCRKFRNKTSNWGNWWPSVNILDFHPGLPEVRVRIPVGKKIAESPNAVQPWINKHRGTHGHTKRTLQNSHIWMHSVARTIFPVFAFKVMHRVTLLTPFCKLLTTIAILSGGGVRHVPEVPQWHDASEYL